MRPCVFAHSLGLLCLSGLTVQLAWAGVLGVRGGFELLGVQSGGISKTGRLLFSPPTGSPSGTGLPGRKDAAHRGKAKGRVPVRFWSRPRPRLRPRPRQGSLILQVQLWFQNPSFSSARWRPWLPPLSPSFCKRKTTPKEKHPHSRRAWAPQAGDFQASPKQNLGFVETLGLPLLSPNPIPKVRTTSLASPPPPQICKTLSGRGPGSLLIEQY